MVEPRSTCKKLYKKSGEPWIRTCGTVTGYIGFDKFMYHWGLNLDNDDPTYDIEIDAV